MATWKDIDLSFMREFGTVVNCRTKEGLRALTTAIGNNYPDYRSLFDEKYSCWDYQHDDRGLSIRAELFEDGSISSGHCNASWYEENGYKIIELSDITCRTKDLGVFDTGYIDMNAALAALF